MAKSGSLWKKRWFRLLMSAISSLVMSGLIFWLSGSVEGVVPSIPFLQSIGLYAPFLWALPIFSFLIYLLFDLQYFGSRKFNAFLYVLEGILYFILWAALFVIGGIASVYFWGADLSPLWEGSGSVFPCMLVFGTNSIVTISALVLFMFIGEMGKKMKKKELARDAYIAPFGFLIISVLVFFVKAMLGFLPFDFVKWISCIIEFGILLFAVIAFIQDVKDGEYSIENARYISEHGNSAYSGGNVISNSDEEIFDDTFAEAVKSAVLSHCSFEGVAVEWHRTNLNSVLVITVKVTGASNTFDYINNHIKAWCQSCTPLTSKLHVPVKSVSYEISVNK